MAVKVTKDYITTPNIVDIREYGYLSDAIAAIGSNQVTLVISELIDVEEHVVVPSNVTLKFTKGGILRVKSGYTVTINGELEAGLYQIFDGSGIISFGAASTDKIHVCWFPSTVEGFQQAVNAALGKTLRIDDGTYDISQVTVTAPLDIVGNGPERSILRVNPSSTYGICFDTSLIRNLITGFYMDLSDTTDNCIGLHSRRGIEYSTIDNITICGNADNPNGPIGIRIDGANLEDSPNNCYDIVFDKCKFHGLYRGVYLYGQNDESKRIKQCKISHSKFSQCYKHIVGQNVVPIIISFNDFDPVTHNGVKRTSNAPRIELSGNCSQALLIGNRYNDITDQLVISLDNDTSDIPYPLVVLGDTAPKDRYHTNSGDIQYVTYEGGLDTGANYAKLDESNTFSKSQHVNDIVDAYHVFSEERKQLVIANKQFTYTGNWQYSNSIADGNIDTYSQSDAVGSTIEWELEDFEQRALNGYNIYLIAHGWWIDDTNNGAIWALDVYNSDTDTWEEVGTFQTNSKLYVFSNPIPYNDPPLCTKLRIRVGQVGSEGIARIAELRVYGKSRRGPIKNIIGGKGDFWELTCQGNQVWHKGNDGPGSGLDADLVRGLPADFTCSKNTSGYTKLPNGLIIQWGYFEGQNSSSNAGSKVTVSTTFPIAFPSACLAVFVTSYNAVTQTEATEHTYAINNYSTTDFSIQAQRIIGSNDSDEVFGIFYYAVGY